MTDQTKELPDEVIYDLLRQLPIPATDDHAGEIKNVHNGLSLSDLVVDWIYDQLRQPDAPEVDYNDPDFDELLGYLDANIPSYIEALCQVVYNWDSLGADGETIKTALAEWREK